MTNSSNGFYDPRFFLPLAAQICRPDAFVDRHLKLVESGVLGLAFASLSSHDPTFRLIGVTVVSRIHAHIQRAKKSLSAEKQVRNFKMYVEFRFLGVLNSWTFQN